MISEPIARVLTRIADDTSFGCAVHTVDVCRQKAGSHDGPYGSPTPLADSRAIGRQMFLPACLVWLFLGCAGCGGDSPAANLQAMRDEKARQEAICNELASLGATCDVDYGRPFPHSRITLGKQWQGGDHGTTLLLRLGWIDELTLATASTDDELLKGLVSGPRLSVLHLRETAVSSQGMVEVGRLKTLVGLGLREVTVADDDWNHICRLSLLWLAIESSKEVFAGDAPKAGHLPVLFSLRLSGTGISDSTVMRAARLGAVRALSLDHANITDAGVASLSELSNLAFLELSSNSIRGLAFGRLKGLRHLRDLVLDRTLCSTEALKALSSLATLESVSLNETPITDLGVGALANMPNLRTVSLVGTNTTDEALRLLASNQSLLTTIDRNGDLVVLQRRWLEEGAGKWLPRWAGRNNKRLFLWTAEGRQPLDALSEGTE